MMHRRGRGLSCRKVRAACFMASNLAPCATEGLAPNSPGWSLPRQPERMPRPLPAQAGGLVYTRRGAASAARAGSAAPDGRAPHAPRRRHSTPAAGGRPGSTGASTGACGSSGSTCARPKRPCQGAGRAAPPFQLPANRCTTQPWPQVLGSETSPRTSGPGSTRTPPARTGSVRFASAARDSPASHRCSWPARGSAFGAGTEAAWPCSAGARACPCSTCKAQSGADSLTAPRAAHLQRHGEHPGPRRLHDVRLEGPAPRGAPVQDEARHDEVQRARQHGVARARAEHPLAHLRPLAPPQPGRPGAGARRRSARGGGKVQAVGAAGRGAGAPGRAGSGRASGRPRRPRPSLRGRRARSTGRTAARSSRRSRRTSRRARAPPGTACAGAGPCRQARRPRSGRAGAHMACQGGLPGLSGLGRPLQRAQRAAGGAGCAGLCGGCGAALGAPAVQTALHQGPAHTAWQGCRRARGPRAPRASAGQTAAAGWARPAARWPTCPRRPPAPPHSRG